MLFLQTLFFLGIPILVESFCFSCFRSLTTQGRGFIDDTASNLKTVADDLAGSRQGISSIDSSPLINAKNPHHNRLLFPPNAFKDDVAAAAIHQGQKADVITKDVVKKSNVLEKVKVVKKENIKTDVKGASKVVESQEKTVKTSVEKTKVTTKVQRGLDDIKVLDSEDIILSAVSAKSNKAAGKSLLDSNSNLARSISAASLNTISVSSLFIRNFF